MNNELKIFENPEIDTEFKIKDGYWKKDGKKLPELEVIFDAG